METLVNYDKQSLQEIYIMVFLNMSNKKYLANMRSARKLAAKKIRARKYGKPRGFKKAVKKIVKQEARRELETKYAATDVVLARPVAQAEVTPGGFIPLTTQVAQGTNDDQRIGDTIKPIVCKAHFTFYFNTDTTNNQDLLVNFWIVRSKAAKAPQQVVSLTGTNFLKLGNGTNVDPNNPNQPQMLTCVSQYPLNKDAYTVLMHQNFRMRKGFGQSAGVSVPGYIAPTGVPAGEDMRTITFSWTPATHHFDATLPAPYTNYPVNEVPLALIWATNADGSGGTQNLVYGLRTEIFYKDA